MTDSEDQLRHLLERSEGTPVAMVTGLWRASAEQRPRWSNKSYRALAGWLVQSGEPLLAYDVATERLGSQRAGAKRDPVLRRLQAHALARTGARERANALLAALRDDGATDEETLGLLASTHKDLALEAAPGSAQRHRHFRAALATYSAAYRGGYWTGINVAVLQLLLGEGDAAQATAKEVSRSCEKLLPGLAEGEGEERYWVLATLGEAALLLGRWDAARRRYDEAVTAGGRRWGNVATTRKQARLILEALQPPADARAALEESLRIPAVVVFTGHMMDRPGRQPPRMPAGLEGAVRAELLDRLRALGAGFGYSSGAMGCDLLFQECLHELGAEAHLIIPYPEKDFLRDSVAMEPGGDWARRFQRARRRANEVITTSQHALDWGGVTYEYANALILGRAQMRAEQLQTDLVPLAVWDGKPGDGPGGTASVVGCWRSHGHAVEIIHLDELHPAAESMSRGKPAAGGGRSRTLPPTAPAEAPPLDVEIRSILFADLVGYSDLTEHQVFAFFRHVLHRVAEFAADTPHEPRIRNTWGDGLFCVFDRVRDAAHFALGLQRIMRGTDWAQHGLPAGLSLRIGLHAGPVFFCTDPVTTRPTYLGTHVNLASRIEPETEFQEIFTSWAFAALTRVERVDDIHLDYVGCLPLQRVAEPLPTYRLTAAHDQRHDVGDTPFLGWRVAPAQPGSFAARARA